MQILFCSSGGERLERAGGNIRSCSIVMVFWKLALWLHSWPVICFDVDGEYGSEGFIDFGVGAGVSIYVLQRWWQ